jgi:hypothetical protein
MAFSDLSPKTNRINTGKRYAGLASIAQSRGRAGFRGHRVLLEIAASFAGFLLMMAAAFALRVLLFLSH